MKRDRAAYMRKYRAERKGIQTHHAGDEHLAQPCKVQFADGTWSACDADLLQERITDLEGEVARLKRELAARPAGPTFNSRPSTPVPKR